MGVIPARFVHLAARDDQDNDFDECDDGYCGPSGGTRWIVAGILIAVVIVGSLIAWMVSVRQISGSWGFIPRRRQMRMLPEHVPSPDGNHSRGRRAWRRSHHAQDEFSDPVPTYNPRLGEGDAGYYNEQGEYIEYEPPPYAPPKAVMRDEVVETGSSGIIELRGYESSGNREHGSDSDSRIFNNDIHEDDDWESAFRENDANPSHNIRSPATASAKKSFALEP